VVNRDGIGDSGVDEFCAAQGLPILMRIPFGRAIAEGIAQGRPLVDINPEYVECFQQMFVQIARDTWRLAAPITPNKPLLLFEATIPDFKRKLTPGEQL
jgi:hypothetical protein